MMAAAVAYLGGILVVTGSQEGGRVQTVAAVAAVAARADPAAGP